MVHERRAQAQRAADRAMVRTSILAPTLMVTLVLVLLFPYAFVIDAFSGGFCYQPTDTRTVDGVTSVTLAPTFHTPGCLGFVLANVTLASLLVTLFMVRAWRRADQRLAQRLEAHPLGDDRTERLFRDRVHEQSLAAGVPAPQVLVLDDDRVNVYAWGRDPRSAQVAVTRGALLLPMAEQEALAAQAVARVALHDARVATWMSTVVGRPVRRAGFTALILFAFPPAPFMAVLFAGQYWHWMVAYLLLAPPVAGVTTALARLELRRDRVLLADAQAALQTREPRAMGRLLHRIHDEPRSPRAGDRFVADVAFHDPSRRRRDSVWYTHPSPRRRFEHLQRGGGRAA